MSVNLTLLIAETIRINFRVEVALGECIELTLARAMQGGALDKALWYNNVKKALVCGAECEKI